MSQIVKIFTRTNNVTNPEQGINDFLAANPGYTVEQVSMAGGVSDANILMYAVTVVFNKPDKKAKGVSQI